MYIFLFFLELLHKRQASHHEGKLSKATEAYRTMWELPERLQGTEPSNQGRSTGRPHEYPKGKVPERSKVERQLQPRRRQQKNNPSKANKLDDGNV